MANLLLYLAVCLIWGSTWLAIQYQIGTVSPAWSVAYRFGIAALLLLGYCYATGCNMRFTRKQHSTMALQGFLLFSINYILYYIGSGYFISGIIAIIFASIIVMNIINNRLFFKSKVMPRVIIGAMLGLTGLATIFWSEIKSLDLSKNGLSHVLMGLVISLTATYLASLGNMVSNYNQKRQLPVLQTNAIGMAYGTLFALIIAITLRQPPQLEWSVPYLFSLFYLAVFGTILAFGSYLRLLGRIGPERAAYAFVFIPIIAMVLSTCFESFAWNHNTIIGVILVLLGNILVLRKT